MRQSPMEENPCSNMWSSRPDYEKFKFKSSEGFQYLFAYFSLLFMAGSWGVLRDFSVHSWEWKRTMEQLHSQHGVSVFIEVSVVPDVMDAQLDIIKVPFVPVLVRSDPSR